jgi:hypothetical protein
VQLKIMNLKFSLVSVFFVPLFFLTISCRHKPDAGLFELVENSGVDFNNKVADGNLENSFYFRNFYNGGGVATGDLNNDGLPDIFFTSNMGDNKLYLNKGGLKFEDITKRSGIVQDSMWSTGVVFVDINHDGWLDIYVCNSGHMASGHRKNQLYINNHDLTFTESAAKYGLDISAYSTQVSFFDYDLDGDLDCFIIENSPIPVNTLNNSNRRDLPDKEWPVGEFLKGGGDHLYRNDNGHFTEVTKAAGIHGSLISFGLGVSIGDINGDGYPDVFVSNDSYEKDYLYINQRDGTFKEQLEEWFGHTSFSSMGADISDINNDGYPEIFTTDMLPDEDFRLKTLGSFDDINLYNAKIKSGFYYQFVKNCLQLNNQNKRFIDIADYSGVSASDWSWGALMFDMDNDGFNDIYICNGVNKDVTNLDFMDFFANDVIQKMVATGEKEGVESILKHVPVHPMLHKAYRNLGNLRFSDEGLKWGFTQTSFANGAAYADLDNDGDLDLIVNNENGKAFIYNNRSREINKNNYIAVQLKGKGENTFAIGSKIKIYEGSQIFYRELIPSRGFQSCMEYKQTIGLGKIAKLDSMVITWPDGSFKKYDHPDCNKLYQISQENSSSSPQLQNNEITDSALFRIVHSDFDKHQEDNNIDFHHEHNLPKLLSREGPKAAVADVNGDGLDDVYIGGTSVHPGQLYLQTKSGKFEKKDEPAFLPFYSFEDDAVLFFDANHDGYPDLFVGPGGNALDPYSKQMQNRMFFNDGHGNFKYDGDAFTSNLNGVNTAVAAAYDFNHDGFLDLFVGGRNVPRTYGGTPQSFIYLNDGKGHFKDIAESRNPDISHIGMVTGACWADITGDSSKELVICGEWMSPRIFSFRNDRFEEIQTNLKGMSGWWESVQVADLNGDGKMDLILGNVGENFYLQPDSANPVKLWVNDYDENGNPDNILSKTVAGKDMPVFLKHDLEFQMPILKKQNLKHGEFAKKTIQELLPEAMLKTSVVKIFNYASSIVAINEGNGRFTIRKLPPMVQLSSVNAIRCTDLNGDGYPDLILGGNEFGFLPQFGRLDGSFGDALINDGKGNFTFLKNARTGFNMLGQVRDIALIKGLKNTRVLFLINDQYPVLYDIQRSQSAISRK